LLSSEPFLTPRLREAATTLVCNRPRRCRKKVHIKRINFLLNAKTFAFSISGKGDLLKTAFSQANRLAEIVQSYGKKMRKSSLFSVFNIFSVYLKKIKRIQYFSTPAKHHKSGIYAIYPEFYGRGLIPSDCSSRSSRRLQLTGSFAPCRQRVTGITALCHLSFSDHPDGSASGPPLRKAGIPLAAMRGRQCKRTTK